MVEIPALRFTNPGLRRRLAPMIRLLLLSSLMLGLPLAAADYRGKVGALKWATGSGNRFRNSLADVTV